MLGKDHDSCYGLELQSVKSMFSAFYKYVSLGYMVKARESSVNEQCELQIKKTLS
jgi:hypothetical protein